MSEIKYYRLVAVERPLHLLGAGAASLGCTYCGKVIDAMGGGCLAVCLDCANSNKLIADILKLEARNKELMDLAKRSYKVLDSFSESELELDYFLGNLHDDLDEAINNE